jgi:uncharacterized membrane protein YdjX (TVP38/TMEM64 family)
MPPPASARTRAGHRRALLMAVFVVITLIATMIVFHWLPAQGVDLRVLSLSEEDVESVARSWAPWTAAASVTLMVLHSFLPLPAEVIAVANGMMFGPLIGVLVTWLGAMLGAVLAFALARYFGRPIVCALVPDRYSRTLDGWESRPAALLIARLLPVISFNLVNFGAGLARVAWWPFLWTTAVGILPLTVLSVVLGNRLFDATWEIAGVFIATAALFWLAVRQRGVQRLVRGLVRPTPR